MTSKNTLLNYDYHSNHDLLLSKDYFEKKGLTGLVNVGNTCFLNSALQCLSHTLKLTDYFLSKKYTDDDEDGLNKKKPEYRLMNSYINLLINLWESNQLIKPKTFLESLSLYIQKYARLQQQDSHECLMYIIDILHKALSYEVEIIISGEPKTDQDKLMKQSLESWKSFYEKNFSFLIEVFNGLHYNKIKCISCNFTENVFEPFNCISLNIPNSNTQDSIDIHECFDNYFDQNEIINSWKCEKCNHNGCQKSTNSWTLPDYLIIQIKRFDNNGKKINKPIHFPMDDLNLTKYISSSKNDPNNYIYSLYAVNYHSGFLNSGHYWSCCKNLDDNWYLFNDGHVTKFNPVQDILEKDAYILFYYRKFIKTQN